ncbi:hypothetical protein IWQ61_004006 [Dispira simplex]|nr:hypothetical protein IWQ61_004006 [Dispira simplex]
MYRLLITSADEFTGFKVAQYLLQLRHQTTTGFDQHSIAGQLLAQLEIYVGLKDPQGKEAQNLVKWGAITVVMDPHHPTLTTTAFLTNVNYVLLIPTAHLNRVQCTTRWIETCQRAQVPHVLLWSTICNQQTNSKFLSQYRRLEMVLQDHSHNELTDAPFVPGTGYPGLAHWAIIRTGWYMEHLYLHQNQLQQDSTLALPTRTGYSAPVRLRDVSIAVLKIMEAMREFSAHSSLTVGPRYYRRTFNFTGPDLLTGHHMALMASRALCKTVDFRHALPSSTWILFTKQYPDDAQNTREGVAPIGIVVPATKKLPAGPLDANSSVSSFSSDISLSISSPVEYEDHEQSTWPSSPDFELEPGSPLGKGRIHPGLPLTHPLCLLDSFDIEFLQEIYQMIRVSRFDLITGDLAAMLGRSPESLGVFFRKKRGDFA